MKIMSVDIETIPTPTRGYILPKRKQNLVVAFLKRKKQRIFLWSSILLAGALLIAGAIYHVTAVGLIGWLWIFWVWLGNVIVGLRSILKGKKRHVRKCIR